MIDRLEYALDIAKADDNIRGVILFGSRANDNFIPDRYSDYDMLFVVAKKDLFCVSVFEDDVKIKYRASDFHPEAFPAETAYLMLFDDYSRIDFLYCTAEDVEGVISRHAIGCPVKCLLDKDNNLNKSFEFDSDYHNVRKMDEKTFIHACEEFFWEIQNVVKGIKRDEISYAMFLRDMALRDMLNMMIDCYIGLKNNYSVTTGVLGRHRRKYLPSELYELYRNTYLSNTAEDVWASLGYMMDLFSVTGTAIADAYGYRYPKADELFMRDYIKCVKEW